MGQLGQLLFHAHDTTIKWARTSAFPSSKSVPTPAQDVHSALEFAGYLAPYATMGHVPTVHHRELMLNVTKSGASLCTMLCTFKSVHTSTGCVHGVYLRA